MNRPHYRARYYNPGIGRFASEDPLRFNSDVVLYRFLTNEVNSYRYVRNNPVDLTDPQGLKPPGTCPPGAKCNPRNPITLPPESLPPSGGLTLNCVARVLVALGETSGWRDKLRHCMMGCIITINCGPDIGRKVASGKEDFDAITALGSPSTYDWIATLDGVDCGLASRDFKSCWCCCKKKGW